MTLHGRILAVGAIPQKLTAAHRHGRRVVIIPAENESDLVYLPQAVKDELEIHLVRNANEAIAIALEPC